MAACPSPDLSSLDQDIGSLIPSAAVRNLEDRPAVVVFGLDIDAALVYQKLEHVCVAVLDGLDEGGMASVDFVRCRKSSNQQSPHQHPCSRHGRIYLRSAFFANNISMISVSLFSYRRSAFTMGRCSPGALGSALACFDRQYLADVSPLGNAVVRGRGRDTGLPLREGTL